MSAAQLPESLLPELRAKWIKLAGAREVVEHAAGHLRMLEGDYQQTLGIALRFLHLDPAQNWRVDLETGEITEAPPEALAQANGRAPQESLAQP